MSQGASINAHAISPNGILLRKSASALVSRFRRSAFVPSNVNGLRRSCAARSVVVPRLGCIIIKLQAMLRGDIERVGTMSTKRKRPAKKGAPKRRKGTPKKKSTKSAAERRAPRGVLASVAMSAVERRSLQGVLASGAFRAHTHWPRKEDVPGYDPTAFN